MAVVEPDDVIVMSPPGSSELSLREFIIESLTLHTGDVEFYRSVFTRQGGGGLMKDTS